MKKVLSSVAFAAAMIFGTVAIANPTADMSNQIEVISADDMQEMAVYLAQNDEPADAVADAVAADAVAAGAVADAVAADEGEKGFIYTLKEYFLTGGPAFMGLVLICLILGMALAIERIIYLNLSSINTKKFLEDVEGALQSGGVEEAKELCRNTRGPIASIFYQGLDRSDEGIEMVEKSVVAYGGVQMGLLEKGVSWISLFIALAPMLGFMGTVIGMIQAFQKIAAVGNLSASLIAGDIQVALLTTVFGLIVAIILQIFYNYIIAKIDAIVNDMEDSSISLIDMLAALKK